MSIFPPSFSTENLRKIEMIEQWKKKKKKYFQFRKPDHVFIYFAVLYVIRY